MNIKMIVTDLDGTLLREDKAISDRTMSVLERCRAKGIKLVYATGRGNSAKVLAPSELFDGFVRMNGAVAYVAETLIYCRTIPIEDVRALLLDADHAGMKIAVECNGIHYSNFNVSAEWFWIPHYEVADFTKLDIKVEKLYAVVRSPQDVELVKNHLLDGMYLYLSRDHLAIITHEEAMKSKAVAALATHWGIHQSEILAFGDDSNDIDLLQYAGLGVAMANAVEEVKAVATHICGCNDDDGVAKWLEGLVS